MKRRKGLSQKLRLDRAICSLPQEGQIRFCMFKSRMNRDEKQCCLPSGSRPGKESRSVKAGAMESPRVDRTPQPAASGSSRIMESGTQRNRCRFLRSYLYSFQPSFSKALSIASESQWIAWLMQSFSNQPRRSRMQPSSWHESILADASSMQ